MWTKYWGLSSFNSFCASLLPFFYSREIVKSLVKGVCYPFIIYQPYEHFKLVLNLMKLPHQEQSKCSSWSRWARFFPFSLCISSYPPQKTKPYGLPNILVFVKHDSVLLTISFCLVLQFRITASWCQFKGTKQQCKVRPTPCLVTRNRLAPHDLHHPLGQMWPLHTMLRLGNLFHWSRADWRTVAA